jgi:DNA-binding NarL/FixJ family response regulator
VRRPRSVDARRADADRGAAQGGRLGHKTQPPDEILEAVHQVLGGVRYLPPAMPTDEIERLVANADAWPLEHLTSREREVFSLMVEGCSNDDIATRLFIARRTVETHRHRVMHKLSARSLVDLVRIALRHGIVVP